MAETDRQPSRPPASGYDGHGRRCIVDRYGTVVLHESRPDEWTLNLDPTDLTWDVWVDVAEAIRAADNERSERG